MGTYVNNNVVTLGEEYDYDDAVREIGALLGVGPREDGMYRLADAAQAGSVNKWSFKKPIRHSATDNVTDDQIISTHCGLAPQKVTKLLAQCIGADSAASYTKDECLAEIGEWIYNKPRGDSYNEWNRIRDFNGYNHRATIPDSGWEQMEISAEELNTLRQVTLDINSSGSYSGYNFVVTPEYNGNTTSIGLYDDFNMRLGFASGEALGDVHNKEIPIKAVVDLDGSWRLALAVWIPNYENGGWGLFASRMTISEFFKSGVSGTQMANLFPDLATNPFAINLMYEYVNGGHKTFDVVPLLVKNLQYTKNSAGVDILRPISGVSDAYCMPSGTASIPFIFGNPPVAIYFNVSYENVASMRVAYIENKDTAPHTFTYRYTKAYMGNITSQGERSITLAGGAKLDVETYNNGSGYSLNVKVIAQDGVAVE